MAVVAARVVENDRATCKGRFAGNDDPCTMFPSTLGGPKMPGIMVGMNQRPVLSVKRRRARCILPLKCLTEHGIVTNRHVSAQLQQQLEDMVRSRSPLGDVTNTTEEVELRTEE